MRVHKVKDVLPHTHVNTSKAITDTALELAEAEFIIKLDDLLHERGLTQQEFAMLSGVRLGTITDFLNGSLTTFNKTRLITFMACLRITDINELVEIRLPAWKIEQYERESIEWKKTQKMPQSVKDIYMRNVTRDL